MDNSFFKNASTAALREPTYSDSKQSYLPPTVANSDILTKIQAFFPAIDVIYQEFAEKHHIPGYSFGVMLEGHLVHSGSGGYINIDKKIPATTQSMFRIASMTKSFTAMAILKLRDAGQLKLDDPVYLYIPEIKNQGLTSDAPLMTIRDLLTHSAGFPSDDPWGDRKLAMTSEELIAFLKKGIFFSNPPGTAYEYSNLGYAMLGLIIEKVSGMSYGKYISENIWQPLDIKQASWEFTEVPAAQLAHGYRWRNENWEEEELLRDGIFGAMGGMIASIESFSQYVALHQSAWPPRSDCETGPIKRSSIREMQQPFRFKELVSHFKYPDGRECPLASAYGYGLKWLQDGEGRVYVGHSGGLPGFGSNWLIMPDYGIGVIYFANVTYAPADTVNLNVFDTLIKGAHLKPKQLPPSQVLKDKKSSLVKLLPDWQNAEVSGLFAENFFLDNSIDLLKNKPLNSLQKLVKFLKWETWFQKINCVDILRWKAKIWIYMCTFP